MNRLDFVDQLPLTVHCDYCVAYVRATAWQVAAYGPGQWIGINVCKCGSCGSLHVGAAGSTRSAKAKADKLRQLFLERESIV